jgi:hypothetical protein
MEKEIERGCSDGRGFLADIRDDYFFRSAAIWENWLRAALTPSAISAAIKSGVGGLGGVSRLRPEPGDIEVDFVAPRKVARCI